VSAASILFEAEGFIAVNKPPGRLVIPGRHPDRGPSLREELQAALGRPLWVVHRLDRDTSGALLFALDAEAHRRLSMAFEAGQVRKRYLGLVAGRIEGPLELEQALVPARRGRMRPARPGEEGKPAHTRVRALELFERASWVEAEPLTGRQHQIRVHLQAAGHPLWVDPQYGRPVEMSEGLIARTPLHASRLEVEGATIEAPLPEDLKAALQRLRQRSR
jgi:tRNA pseudouridine32 synthase/23S rRNA pseudouridine746 synthase/23S rRNA pseudouridine955/2504/2580 synthase